MTSSTHPELIGQYQIKRLIASGGMGSVYEALQANPRRTVAIKIVRTGEGDSGATIARFHYEAQVLARLRHPGIAEIYEAGTFEDDGNEVPFFAMEFIPNAKALTDYANSEKLDTRARLELFVQVCEAVHHGHQRGIVHRDLKPANILVDAQGMVKIIDFGVARATDSDLRQTRVHTTAGELIGSVQYMSPEQFKADSDDIDTRSDVYALGVVLYELLTGCLPYDLRGRNIYEIAQIVAETTPEPIGTHLRDLSEELDTIVQMALRKERSQRYQSAHGLCLDVKRYLSGEAIAARPPSFTYQFRVFARRNRAVVSTATFGVLALVAGIVLAVTLLIRVDAERAQAMAAKQFLTDVFKEGIPPGYGNQATVEMILNHARRKLAVTDFGDPETEADVRDAIGQGYGWIGYTGTYVEECSRALALYEEVLGPTHDKSLGMRDALFYGYRFLRDHDKSLANVDALISGLAQRYGEMSKPVLEWRSERVGVLNRAGRLADALAACRELEKDCESQLGQTSLLSLDVGAELAWLMMESDILDSARQIARDVHSRASLASGESGNITNKTRSVLAGVLIAQGELDAAASLYGNQRLPGSFGIEHTFQGDTACIVDAGPKLYIFFETWCPYTHNSVPDVENQYHRFHDQGIEFVGLTRINRSASEESVEQFIRDWEITFPVYKEDGTAWDFFKCVGTPSMRLVDNGQLLWESYWNPADQMLKGIVRARSNAAADSPES